MPYPKEGIIPPPQSIPEEFSNTPKIKEVHEKVHKLWNDFLAANPEAAPDKPISKSVPHEKVTKG